MASHDHDPVDFSRIFDVLVIGGGNAALCAAMSAREGGADVLLLECAPEALRGGNSRHTRNLRYLHRHGDHILTGPYLEDEFWEDLQRVTEGNTDEDLARLTLRESTEIGRWMEAHGCRFQPPLKGTLHLARTNAHFLGGGKALMNAYYATAKKMGVRILYDAEVTDLTIKDGRFDSVCFVSHNVPRTVRAKTVVAAAGGFQANISWLKEAWGNAADNFIVRGSPYDKGRLLRVLLDLGIKPVGDPRQCHAIALDARAPKFDGGIVTRLDCVPLGIVVNRHGRRFYDEGEEFWPKRYAIWGHLVARQPDQVAYAIIDSKSIDLFMPSVFPPIEADTIEGLAEKLTLDPSVLEATVADFNRSVQPGTFDLSIMDDCATEGLDIPKSHWARRLDTPPFYGYPLRTGITFTYLAVSVNDRAQVILQTGEPVPNIFAAGEMMAGNILGKGYLAGFGMTIGTVWGRIAGKEAARAAVN